MEIEREDFGVVLNATLTLLALVIGFSFLDGNFWYGGRSTINGIEGNDNQRNSRAGVAVAIPVSQHQ